MEEEEAGAEWVNDEERPALLMSVRSALSNGRIR